jgi:hypothetical protein
MKPIANPTTVYRLVALACLVVALASPPAVAVGGGTPDPSEFPVLQALRVQVQGLDQDILAVTGIIEPADLPSLRQLADKLARIDAHFALAAVGGGSPDPGASINPTLLELRTVAGKVREHAGAALAKAGSNSSLGEVAKALRFLQATARMLVARIDYALPIALTPTPEL